MTGHVIQEKVPESDSGDSPRRACLACPATTCPLPVPCPFSLFRVPIGLGTLWGIGDHLSSLVVVVELSNMVLDPPGERECSPHSD